MGIHEQKIMQLMKAHDNKVCFIGEDYGGDFDDELHGAWTIELLGKELVVYDKHDDEVIFDPVDWEDILPVVKLYYGATKYERE